MRDKIILAIPTLLTPVVINFFFWHQSANVAPTFNSATANTVSTLEESKNASAIDNSGLTMTTKRIRETNEKYSYQIAIEYPVFHKAANEEIIEKINDAIEKKMRQEADGFIKEAIVINVSPDFPKSSFDAKYKYSVIEGRIVSVTEDFIGHYSGAAHPYFYTSTLNYDLNSGLAVTLSDLFRPSSDYLSVISAYVKDDLDKKFGANNWIPRGVEPISKNYQNFTFSSGYLNFIFNPYQITSGGQEAVTIAVPLEKLADKINQQWNFLLKVQLNSTPSIIKRSP